MRTANGAFDLQVLVDGAEAYEFVHNGETYIEGRRDREYTLRVHNNTGGRLLAVLSVDGLSVMDGRPASTTRGGYVLDPYRCTDIRGWRLNDREVARFFFGSLPQAYAAQMGQPRNIGVIGASVFSEHVPAPVRYFPPPASASRAPAAPTYDGTPSPAAPRPQDAFPTLGAPPPTAAPPPPSMAPPQQQAPSPASAGIGTGFGARTQDAIRHVSFARSSEPPQVLVLRYDDAAGLRARGIDLERAASLQRVDQANPFPADRGAPPPPGWRG